MTLTARVRVVMFVVMLAGMVVVTVLTLTGVGPNAGIGARISMAGLIAFGVALWVILDTGGLVTTETRLRIATDGWTAPVVIRQYTDDRQGHANARTEATILAGHGHPMAGQSGSSGHINVGRTLTGAALTGGLLLLFGGSRTPGVVDITFVLA